MDLQSTELMYLMSLTHVPGIGSPRAFRLLEAFGSAAAVFSARRDSVRRVLQISDGAADAVREFRGFDRAEQEIKFMRERGIQALTYVDAQYPQRLLHCADPAVLLYFRGNGNLNHPRLVSIVGTRSATEQGKLLAEKLCAELAGYGCAVVSGLASGIDGSAHRAALQHGMPTIGVLGHGLQMMYPASHGALAQAMLPEGGLLTEYDSRTGVERFHFPERNRLVAGISAATVVIESPLRGGSLITADIAQGYNHNVFAYPGRSTDVKMAGNLWLIRTHRAEMITSGRDVAEAMNWKPLAVSAGIGLPETREAPTKNEQQILRLFAGEAPVFFDSIQHGSGLSPGENAEALLFLEMKGWLRSLPGRKFMLQGTTSSAGTG